MNALADTVPLIELRGITKAYPGCIANDRIDLAVGPGEVHALLGENGAGKSTLVKIMYGVVSPDEGELRWQGQAVTIDGPAAARRLGIGMVFQHFTLFETLTVAENVELGGSRRVDRRALAAKITEVAGRYGLAVDPARRVHNLSVGERQRVEIVRCLLEEPKLIILDEPTSVLTPQEADALFATLRLLAAEGRGVLFISHKLDEVRAVCTRATVLRAGKRVAGCDPRQESAASIARLMVGADVPEAKRGAARAPGAARLELTKLSWTPADPHGVPLRGLDLTINGGEIFGIAGVAGNGQTELLAAISGEATVGEPGAVRIGGKPVGRLGPAARRKFGLAVIPEERLGRGAVAEMSLTENSLLTAADEGLVRRGLVSGAAAERYARRVIGDFNVVARGPGAEARSLSGGNLQKYILGREILRKPTLLVAAHPTWGVDIGAAAAIHRALIGLRDAGAAILLISEDLDELLAITDRIAVISKGRLSPAGATVSAERGQLGEWMSGMAMHETQAHAA